MRASKKTRRSGSLGRLVKPRTSENDHKCTRLVGGLKFGNLLAGPVTVQGWSDLTTVVAPPPVAGQQSLLAEEAGVEPAGD